jgi:hypothetical protein
MPHQETGNSEQETEKFASLRDGGGHETMRTASLFCGGEAAGNFF